MKVNIKTKNSKYFRAPSHHLHIPTPPVHLCSHRMCASLRGRTVFSLRDTNAGQELGHDPSFSANIAAVLLPRAGIKNIAQCMRTGGQLRGW